jgi:hypothetical protein
VPESGPLIKVPQFDGIPREAGEVWTLRKGTRVATCHLWTHLVGAEIRATVDGELSRSEAGRSKMAIVDLALEWRDQFKAKGW